MPTIVIFTLAFFISSCISLESKHLQLLKEKYPHGLLTDDYGILNIDDLAINTCDGEPSLYGTGNLAYQYWQCFPTKDVSFECDEGDYDSSYGEVTAIMAFKIFHKKEKIEYISRRGFEFSSCKEYGKDLERAMNGEDYICFSGEDGATHEETHYWVFDRFKTKKECVSYFHGGCDLQYQIKNGCKAVTYSKNN